MTDQQSQPAPAPAAVKHPSDPPGGRRFGQTELVVMFIVATVLGQRLLVPWFDSPALQTWATMFVAIVVQALPFLVLGVTVAGVIAACVSDDLMRRLLPERPILAVPAAGLAGVALPGCECASVPIAGSLIGRGVAPAAAFTFLLAAPAINPVVLVATAVAFPQRPEMVIARLVASLATSVVVGWLWCWKGRDDLVRLSRSHLHEHAGRLATFRDSAHHDLVQAGGFLVLGAALAASVNTLLPRAVLDTVAHHAVLGVLALAVLAVVVALCSEADAFVAASLVSFSDTAKLTFLVVGPAVDVKLAALQAGQFGAAFARRFAPLTFVVAVVSSSLFGWLLL